MPNGGLSELVVAKVLNFAKNAPPLLVSPTPDSHRGPSLEDIGSSRRTETLYYRMPVIE